MISASLPSETPGVQILVHVVTTDYFSFSSSLVFLFLSRNHLPKGSVCLSVSCVKKIVSSLLSFVYDDCFRIHNIALVSEGKTTETPWIESLRKNHKYFPYNEKSRYTFHLSKITDLTRCQRLWNGLRWLMFETREDSYMKRSGMLVVSGTNQGFWSPLGCWWRNVIIFSCQSIL